MGTDHIITDSEIILACISTYLNTRDFAKLATLNTTALSTARISACCVSTFVPPCTFSRLTNINLGELYLHALPCAWVDLLSFIQLILNGLFAVESIQYVTVCSCFDCSAEFNQCRN